MMVAVPAELAERERLKAEKARARRERYEQRNRDGNNNLSSRRTKYETTRPDRSHHAADEPRYRHYPFVMWDGEAPTDTGYSLFGSSEGHEICKPHLTTEECFDLLLEAKQDMPLSIFFWYGGRYDWDEITRQSIPLKQLNRLKTRGTLWWHGYRLKEIEGKAYTITKDGISVKIFEVTGWFHTTYANACRQYRVGDSDCPHGGILCGSNSSDPCECTCKLCRIELGKSQRGGDEFTWDEIEFIRKYMHDELAVGPQLMDRIRDIVLAAGFNPRSWYGPSALARELLTRHKITKCMAETPREVNRAAQFAFAGGRFEPFRGGVLNVSCTTVDENSAYMSAALDLPNLAAGSWRRGKGFEPGKFAVYHIRYEDRSRPFDIMKPQPLFRRFKNGNVQWPRRVEGWYWSPEAELVKDNPDAKFLEAWIFDESSTERPFIFVSELYRRRLLLQGLPAGNSSKQAEKAIKWALAAIYGQLCRIVGWDEKNHKAPETHQLEWAGYITSKCRADMYKVAIQAGNRLVSIDTDSVTAIGDLDVPTGLQLGQWKKEIVDAGVFFQSGVYFTKTAGVWSKGKTRGMERRQRNVAAVTPELLTEAIRSNCNVKLSPKKRYITTRMALNGQLDHHGQWRSHPGNVLEFGGGGKRYHNSAMCKSRCSGDIHIFFPAIYGLNTDDIFDTESIPHYLPWKDTSTNYVMDTNLLNDIMWVSPDNIDEDDKWIAELVKAHAAT